MNELRQVEIDFFRRAGYLKLKNKFSNEFIDRINTKLNVFKKDRVKPYKIDGNDHIIKIFNLYDRSELFKELFTSKLILNPLMSILGPNIEFLKNRHNHASVISKFVNEKRFHRDILHWSRGAIAVLVYSQDSNIENGTTEIIPTSQNLPYVEPAGLPHHAGTWLDDFDVYNNFENQAVPVIMKKGEILIFDTLVFHSPGINLTDQTRYAVTAAYQAMDELLPSEFNTQKVLVSGERKYCGNEFNWS